MAGVGGLPVGSGEVGPPRRGGHGDADAQEADGGLGEDSDGEGDAGEDDDEGDDVGEDVAPHDAGVAGAEGAGGLDVDVLLDGEDGAANDPGGPGDDSHADGEGDDEYVQEEGDAEKATLRHSTGVSLAKNSRTREFSSPTTVTMASSRTMAGKASRMSTDL